MNLLDPFRPTPADPFDLGKAGHLLRRAAFGGSLEERRQAVADGVDRAVDRLFEPGRGDDVDTSLEDVLALGGVEQLRAYRVWRMLRGRERLRERMSYFWHDHFATSQTKVKNVRMMGRQLHLFDTAGLGRFDDLLLAVSRDPAMVRWLDNETNVAGKANENYARELFELFALGEGHYTERDVQEAARAFTGWHLRGESFAFRRRHHDAGEKEVLGRSGRLTGEDVVALAAAHPASARFIAGKLLRFFVHPEPTPEEVDAVAALYRDKGRHIGDTLRVLLKSRLFFGTRAWRSRVKSPADFVVGLVRSLGADAAPLQLARAMGQMGEVLLEPPNVAGWPGERAWITSATWLVRANFAAGVLAPRFKLRPAVTLELVRPADRVDALLELLLDGAVPAPSRAAIRAHARKADRPGDLVHAILCLPEGQML